DTEEGKAIQEHGDSASLCLHIPSLLHKPKLPPLGQNPRTCLDIRGDVQPADMCLQVMGKSTHNPILRGWESEQGLDSERRNCQRRESDGWWSTLVGESGQENNCRGAFYLKKGRDTVGELKSAEIYVSHMPWKAKKPGNLR